MQNNITNVANTLQQLSTATQSFNAEVQCNPQYARDLIHKLTVEKVDSIDRAELQDALHSAIEWMFMGDNKFAQDLCNLVLGTNITLNNFDDSEENEELEEIALITYNK